MKKVVLLWAFAISFIISSCSFSLVTEQKGFNKIVPLTGATWNISDSLNRVGLLFLTDDWLVVSDNNLETHFALYNLDDHSVVHRFGKRGQGPKEVLKPMPLIVHDDTIDLFDDNREALLRFDIDEITNGNQGVSEVVFNTTHVHTVRCVEFPEGNMLVNFGMYEGGRFCLLDFQGNVLSYAGDYPQEDPNAEYPSWVMFSAYQGQMLRQPHGNRFAISTYNAELLEIYECDYLDKSIKRTFIRCNNYPFIKTVSSNGLPAYVDSENTIFGYCDMYVTDKYIYALYSGQKNDKASTTIMGNTIQVFDWEGNAICLYQLDQYASSITGNDDVLYAHVKTADGGDDIREYKLNKIN